MDTKKKVAVSVVFIAFAYGLNVTGISPILGVLNEKYAEYGASLVRFLQTLPYLLVMAGSLSVGWLTIRFPKKKIVMAGLTIIGCCGAIPFFYENFTLLIITRMLIGLGFGMVGPLNTAIISEFFSPEERVNYMGLHVVGMGIGAMAGNVAGGFLAGFGYRFFYLVYMAAFLCVLAVRLLLVETPPAAVQKVADLKLNKKVYAIAFASFVHTLFINVYSTNIGIYIFDQVTEDTLIPGIATGINAVAALMMGLLFGRVSKIFGKYTMPLSVFMAAVGYACLIFLKGMPGVLLVSICCGLSLSCFMASGSYLISISVETEAVAKASGLFSIIGGIGGLIAPIVMGQVSTAVLGNDSPVSQFAVALAGMLFFGLAVCVVIRSGSRRQRI